MARELSRHGAGKGLHQGLYALPHSRASRTDALRRRQTDRNRAADVDVSAALLSDEDSEASRPADRRRRRTARATSGGLAPAGSIPDEDQPEFLAALGLFFPDTSPPERQSTHVIYTEYDLPQQTRQPHDAIVDSEGM